MPQSIAYNCDCLEYMRTLPDKTFALCVADPPYGINRFKNGETSRLRKYGSLKSVNDAPFSEEMFNEIQRVSENAIIWGYNHLSDILPPTSEFVFWYKHQPVISYADGELAWTSFTKTARCIDLPYFGNINADQDGRIHPTQKPIALYQRLYEVYIKIGGGIIFDPFLGSGSSRIAAYDAGLDFVGCEIDEYYFNKQEERFAKHITQRSIFDDDYGEAEQTGLWEDDGDGDPQD